MNIPGRHLGDHNMSAKYAWAPGAPFSGDANEVQAEIERIKRLPGGATPASIVVQARPKRSPLHPLIFHLPEAEAAERYYLGRATNLLNAIRVVSTEGEVLHVRANIRMVEGDEHIYGSPDDVAARKHRADYLRRRLLNIKAELSELDLYPMVAQAIELEFAEAA